MGMKEMNSIEKIIEWGKNNNMMNGKKSFFSHFLLRSVRKRHKERQRDKKAEVVGVYLTTTRV